MIRVVESTAAVTLPLRLAVLRPDAPAGTPGPGDDHDAVHLAAVDGDDLVGAAVLLPRPVPGAPDEPAWQLRGMAVAPDRQGAGIGAAVLSAALTRTRGRVLWCNARSTARRFYERHGFQARGSEFATPETGIPHFLMTRNPDAAPPRP